jgi:hypothetical protein
MAWVGLSLSLACASRADSTSNPTNIQANKTPSYTDADWAFWAEGTRGLQARTRQYHPSSKDHAFEQLDGQMQTKEEELSLAIRAKDTRAFSETFESIRVMCKACHTE